MSKFVVEIKGLFETLYLENSNYKVYQATVKDISRAKKFNTLAEAQKQAKQVKGKVNIIEIDEDSDYIIRYDLIHCKNCGYYDEEFCHRTKMPTNPTDYCSRGQRKCTNEKE